MKKVFVILTGGVKKEAEGSDVRSTMRSLGLETEGWTYMLNNNSVNADAPIPYDYSTLIVTKAMKGGNR